MPYDCPEPWSGSGGGGGGPQPSPPRAGTARLATIPNLNWLAPSWGQLCELQPRRARRKGASSAERVEGDRLRSARGQRAQPQTPVGDQHSLWSAQDFTAAVPTRATLSPTAAVLPERHFFSPSPLL